MRLLYSQLTNFERDERAIFEVASRFFTEGVLVNHGAEVVYTRSFLPGSLLNFLIGGPLYLSGGYPWASSLCVVILALLTSYFIYFTYRRIFPEISKELLFSFVFLSPWLIVNSKLWNPSFLPLFSSFFFMGVSFDILKKNRILSSALMIFGILGALQFHMSFVLLIGFWVFLIFFRVIRFPHFLGIFLGGVLGSLSLFSYWVEKFSATPVEERGGILSNIIFNPHHLDDLFRILFRFVGFSSGEVTRYFARGGGWTYTTTVLKSNWILWPGYVGLLLGSLYLILVGLRFYLDLEKTKLNFKRFDYSKEEEKRKLDFFIFWVPILTWISFLFSIKGPSAHTYWILYPMSLYPILRVVNEKKRIAKWVSAKSVTVIFLICLSVGTLATFYSPYVTHLYRLQLGAQEILKETSNPEEWSEKLKKRPESERDGIQTFLRVIRH